ncbi:MAG: hypothetical protein ACRELY_22970, partial [Polyangiaceae bacterium]
LLVSIVGFVGAFVPWAGYRDILIVSGFGVYVGWLTAPGFATAAILIVASRRQRGAVNTRLLLAVICAAMVSLSGFFALFGGALAYDYWEKAGFVWLSEGYQFEPGWYATLASALILAALCATPSVWRRVAD